MNHLSNIIVTLNSLFFLLYGFQCVKSKLMVKEFERYGLPDEMRILTGALQMLGALGLFTGFFFPLLGIVAAGGLALMMMVAFSVRIKIKDPFIESFPSLFFMVLNAYICILFFQLW